MRLVLLAILAGVMLSGCTTMSSDPGLALQNLAEGFQPVPGSRVPLKNTWNAQFGERWTDFQLVPPPVATIPQPPATVVYIEPVK